MPNDEGHKTPTKSNSNRKDKAKQAVLERCCSEIDEAMVENGGRKLYGIVAEMVKDLKGVCPWITRHVINFAYEKHMGRIVKKDKPQKKVAKQPQKVGGRPIRTMDIALMKSRFGSKNVLMQLQFYMMLR